MDACEKTLLKIICKFGPARIQSAVELDSELDSEEEDGKSSSSSFSSLGILLVYSKTGILLQLFFAILQSVLQRDFLIFDVQGAIVAGHLDELIVGAIDADGNSCNDLKMLDRS